MGFWNKLKKAEKKEEAPKEPWILEKRDPTLAGPPKTPPSETDSKKRDPPRSLLVHMPDERDFPTEQIPPNPVPESKAKISAQSNKFDGIAEAVRVAASSGVTIEELAEKLTPKEAHIDIEYHDESAKVPTPEELIEMEKLAIEMTHRHEGEKDFVMIPKAQAKVRSTEKELENAVESSILIASAGMMTIEEATKRLTPVPESQDQHHLGLIFDNKDPVKEGCNCALCKDDRAKKSELCMCDSPVSAQRGSHQVLFEDVDLTNGNHTTFTMMKCSKCGKPKGFPSRCLEIALTEGTEETKQMIRESYKDMEP